MNRTGIRGWSLVAILLAACHAETAVEVRAPEGAALAARGGGGGGEAPTVISANPSTAPQDTAVDVTISGTGFTIGAKAEWSLNGNSSHVTVKSTKVVSSTQLVSRVLIPLTAPVGSYDIVVTLSDGKKGVGAEKFAITEKDPSAEFWFPLDDAALGLRSDHLYVNGLSSVYEFGMCGVNTRIFVGGSGDAIMHTDNSKFTDRRCSAYPRKMQIDYGDGVTLWSTVFVNVREIQNLSYMIPVGATVKRALHVNESRCDGLLWKGHLADGTLTNGADSVLVTRTGGDSWLVETQPYPDNEAYCRATGVKYNIAARFTVIASRSMP